MRAEERNRDAGDAAAFAGALRQVADALGVPLDGDQAARLARHQRLVATWNGRVRMVADARPEAMLVAHYADALALLRPALAPWLGQGVLVDAGSGAGFPGLVLACVRRGGRVVLVEPAPKRASFLRLAVRQLGLGDVDVVERGVEAGDDAWADVAISRAVFTPARWLRRGVRLVRPGGVVVSMLTTAPDAALRAAAERAGLSLVAADAFALPRTGAARVNAVWRRRSEAS